MALVVVTTVIFDAGIATSVIRFADDKRTAWPVLLGTAACLQVAASGVAIAIVAPAQVLLAPNTIDPLVLVAITASFAAVEGAAALASGILRAQGRNRRFLTLSVVRLIATALLAGAGSKAFGLTGALLGLAFGGLPFAAQAVWTCAASRPRFDLGVGRLIARYGLPLIVSSLALWTLAASDRLFLQYSVSAADLGQYGANYRIGAIVLTFIAGPIALAWLPVARREPATATARARTWALGFTLLCAVVVLALVVAAPLLIPAFYGSDFEADRLVIGLVGIAGWLGGLFPLLATPALMTDSTLVLSVAVVPVIVVALVLNAVLISAFGTDGAAVSTVLSYLALCAATAAAMRGRVFVAVEGTR